MPDPCLRFFIGLPYLILNLHLFWRVLSSYSGRIRKLFDKSQCEACRQVIFHDFPGGAANFELITRFCYSKGKVNINPFNISNLTCAAYYMEMNEFVTGMENLCEQMEKSLEEIKYWTWSDLLVALKQCQEQFPGSNSLGILDKCLDCLIGCVASSCETSPCPSSSSPDSSGFRLSCDTRSIDGLKNSFSRASWWFEDLVALDTPLIEMLVGSMLSKNFDNGIIGRFLLYYQKSRFASASMDDKTKIIETVVEMLYSLEMRSVPCKSLLGMLRVALNVNISQCSRNKLESMIGAQLDEATLDNLLFPSPILTSYLYDVNLVLRFLKSFFAKGVCCVPLSRLKKVASLMDLYLAEVSPDPHLKPSKFLALIKAIPDSARDSCDEVYYAVNLYLEVHSSLCEEQKIKICFGLNYDKLSSEAFNHLSQNTKFPSRSAVQALVSQQRKLKNLLQDTNQPTTFTHSPFSPFRTSHKGIQDESSQQIVLFAKKLNFSKENEKLKAHLQGMQWRVLELEKDCRKMQIQMTKMVKSRLSSHNKAKSAPKLCS